MAIDTRGGALSAVRGGPILNAVSQFLNPPGQLNVPAKTPLLAGYGQTPTFGLSPVMPEPMGGEGYSRKEAAPGNASAPIPVTNSDPVVAVNPSDNGIVDNLVELDQGSVEGQTTTRADTTKGFTSDFDAWDIASLPQNLLTSVLFGNETPDGAGGYSGFPGIMTMLNLGPGAARRAANEQSKFMDAARAKAQIAIGKSMGGAPWTDDLREKALFEEHNKLLGIMQSGTFVAGVEGSAQNDGIKAETPLSTLGSFLFRGQHDVAKAFNDKILARQADAAGDAAILKRMVEIKDKQMDLYNVIDAEADNKRADTSLADDMKSSALLRANARAQETRAGAKHAAWERDQSRLEEDRLRELDLRDRADEKYEHSLERRDADEAHLDAIRKTERESAAGQHFFDTAVRAANLSKMAGPRLAPPTPEDEIQAIRDKRLEALIADPSELGLQHAAAAEAAFPDDLVRRSEYWKNLVGTDSEGNARFEIGPAHIDGSEWRADLHNTGIDFLQLLNNFNVITSPTLMNKYDEELERDRIRGRAGASLEGLIPPVSPETKALHREPIPSAAVSAIDDLIYLLALNSGVPPEQIGQFANQHFGVAPVRDYVTER